jgi:hypothetical protein
VRVSLRPLLIVACCFSACIAACTTARAAEAVGGQKPGLIENRALWEPPTGAIHIDPRNTNDAAEDGSRKHPFDSVSDIRWRDNAVYVLRRGTTLTTEAFTANGKGITLASYGAGNRPLIQCRSIAGRGKNYHAIRVDSGDGLVVRDLEIDAPRATSCLRLGGGCRDVRVDNCLLNGAAWGLRAFSFSGLKVINTEIRNIKDDGMFVVGVTGIEIAHCYVHDVNQNWVAPYTPQSKAGGDSIQLVNCDDWHVHRNVLDRTNSGNKFCFIANNPEQRQGIFEHNVTRGPLTTGDGGSSVYFHDGDGLVVRYNTILGPSPGVLYSHSANLQIYGNIMAHTAGGVFASKSAHVANNVFYQVKGALVSGGHITFVNNAAEVDGDRATALDKVKKLTAHHNLIVDMGGFGKESLFEAPAGLDFRPARGSRCVDAGCDAGIERDRTGVTIPCGKAPDIGAFERP